MKTYIAMAIAAHIFTGHLSVGSTGPEVTALQAFLQEQGELVLPPSTSAGYFGRLTWAALARYQAIEGITPASGYFGPLTMANINAKETAMQSIPVSVGTTSTGSGVQVNLVSTSGPTSVAPSAPAATPSRPATNLPAVEASAAVRDPNSSVSDDAQGVYSLTFSMGAFADDMYIPLVASRSASGDPSAAGVHYVIEDSSGSIVADGTSSAVLTRVSGGSETNNFAKASDGQTVTLRLSVSFDPVTAGQYRLRLIGINYRSGQASTPDAQESASPASRFRTSYIDIQG